MESVDTVQLGEEQKARILALASDFPKLWHDPKTLDRDRKRMARQLLEDVTLQQDRHILIQVCFRGGATRELRLPLPKAAWALRKTKPEIVAEIDRLMEDHTVSEIVHLLNDRGWHSSNGSAFSFHNVNHLKSSIEEPPRAAARTGLADRSRSRGLARLRLELHQPLA